MHSHAVLSFIDSFVHFLTFTYDRFASFPTWALIRVALQPTDHAASQSQPDHALPVMTLSTTVTWHLLQFHVFSSALLNCACTRRVDD